MSHFYRYLRCSVAIFALAVCAFAASAKDLGELELNKVYNIDGDFQAWSAQFTAPKSGALNAFSTGGLTLVPYYDAAHTEEKQIPYDGSYVDGGYVYSFEVEAGTTYYFYLGFSMNAAQFSISMEQTLQLTGATIEPGGILSCSGYADVEYTFNAPVIFDAVNINVEGQTIDFTSDTRADNYAVVVDLKDKLLELLKSEPSLGGKPCTLTISGLRSSKDESLLFNGDGVLTINYILGSLPAQKVSDNTASFVMYSYFPEGDPRGFVTLEFDRDLQPGEGSAYYVYGNPEGDPGESNQEYLPVIVDGKIAKIDFTGKLRRPRDLVKSGELYNYVLFQVSGLKSADGQYVFSDGLGTLGSFSYYLNYKEIYVNLISEFTPASGSSLANCDNIEIYINTNEGYTFDGVKFTWPGSDQAVIVPNDQLTITPDAFGGVTILVPVTAAVTTAKNALLELNNLVTIDGVDHSRDVTATYNGFVVTNTIPADGTQLSSLVEGAKLVAWTNMYDQVNYLTYQMYDKTAEEFIITPSSLQKVGDNKWEAEFYQNIKLLLLHTYEVTFFAYAQPEDEWNGVGPLGSASVFYEGLTPEYKYSPTQFTWSFPGDGARITSAADRSFEIYFDGLVQIDLNRSFVNLGFDFTTYQPRTAKFESCVAAEELIDEFSNGWILTIPEGILDEEGRTDLSLCIQAYDIDGLIVKGNEGEEGNSFIVLNYTVSIGGGGFSYTITPAEGITASLKDFSIVFDENYSIGIDWGTTDRITLYKGEEKVGDIKNDDITVVWTGWTDLNNEAQFSFPEAFTAEGDYTLVIPANVFTLNDGWEWNPEIKVAYSIGSSGIDAIIGEKPEAYSVYDLNGRHVITTTDRNALSNLRGAYIINGVKMIIVR